MSEQMKVGTIGWHDLTVPDAEGVRDFYAAVAGWEPQPVDMGGYSDFGMAADGKGVAGICHARGVNANLPAQWLMYIIVADIDASLKEVHERGGRIVAGPRTHGAARFAVISDPAGAVCALYQP